MREDMEIGCFYTGNPEIALAVWGGDRATRGEGLTAEVSQTWKGVRSHGLRQESGEQAHGPYLVVNIELDVLWQGADVSAGADVVVHDSGDGGVVESLWDPL